MRKIIAAFAALLGLLSAAAAQTFPQTLPANTVYGRLGVSAGPGQAIPFSVLTSNLLTSLCTTSGAFLIYNATTGAWVCSTVGGTGSLATLNGGPLTITPAAASTTRGIDITQTGPTTGTSGGTLKYNSILINSDQASITDTAYGLDVTYGFGGSNLRGQRAAIRGFSVLNSASDLSNPTKVYIGVSGEAQISANDGGINTGAGAAGEMRGLYGSGIVAAGATDLYRVAGLELNTSIRATSSARYNFGQMITQWADHAVSAAEIDAGLYFGNQSGAIGWHDYGIVFDTTGNGIGTAFLSTATIIGSKGSMSVTNGVDVSSATISGCAYKSFRYCVNGGGSVLISGSSSGQATISAQAAAGSPTLTLPNASGTFAVSASSPVAVSATTGNITCATCATTTNGGALSGTAPVAISAAGAISITGAAGQVLAGSPAAFTATPTLGASGTLGSLTFGNATSGLLTLQPVTGALGTITVSLPAATDTLVGKATTDILTNKTYDTAGTGNVFKINGTTISAVTGTGSAVLATSPTLVTPTLGVATATDLELTGTGSQNNRLELNTTNLIAVFTGGQKTATFQSDATSANFMDIRAKASGTGPFFIGNGTDTNVNIEFGTKGTGQITFRTDVLSTFPVQTVITHTAGATRYLMLTGSNGGNPTFATSGGGFNFAPNNGHATWTAGSTPTAGTCTGFGATAGSTDTQGRITYTSATTCSINFGTAFSAAPFCTVVPGSAASTTTITTSTTQLAVTFGTAQTAFFYHCFGA